MRRHLEPGTPDYEAQEREDRRKWEQECRAAAKEALKTMGQKLKAQRKRARFTQAGAAAHLQKDRSVISKIERGQYNLTMGDLVALFKGYNEKCKHEKILLEDIRQKLKDWRKEALLNQTRAASVIEKNQPVISEIERGKNCLYIYDFVALCEAYGISPKVLLKEAIPISSLLYPITDLFSDNYF